MSVKKAKYGIQPTPEIVNRRTGYVRSSVRVARLTGPMFSRFSPRPVAGQMIREDHAGPLRPGRARLWRLAYEQLLGLLPHFYEQPTHEQTDQLKNSVNPRSSAAAQS